ncbi:cadherin-like domain-containing protein, partial [Sulfitobacter mediterraneus]|uniref:Calx-beta domain-containing protein n=3 Tax=Sulfitobacter mediterraneus TaxID=83219 RepID=UPI0019392774
EGTDFYDPHYLVWTLNLSEASAEAVTVEYRFLNGTALYGVDTYTGSGTLTFAAGETTREIYLRIDGDSGVELDESIVLELSDPSGAAFAGQAPVLRATSWILDDDGADEPRALFVSNPVVFEGDTGSREAVFELSLSRPAAADFEVTFATADGTALAGEDYQATTGTLTFAAGQTQASVSVPVFGDTDIEPSEGFTLTVTAPEAVAAVSAGQAQILADDAGTPTLSVIGSFSPEGTDFYDPHYLVWTLNLSEASAEAVTVEYRFLNGTALYGVDTYTGSGTLTFAAGETTREIYLRIDGDSGVELDESIVLELSDPSGAAFAGQAPVLRATSWILDDDGADEPRALFVSNPVVFEGDTGSREAVFELSLSRPAAADFEVTFATADGTALAGEDYQATTGTLTFAAGQTQASVSVPVFGDTDIEPSEGFTLTVTAPEAVAAVSGGTGEIASDDSFPPVVEDDVATVRADQILSGFNVLANDSDPEGGGLTLVSVEADRPLGTLTFLADGTITYDPGAAFADLVEGRAESENFSYVVRDDLGVTTTGSLRIDVTGAQPFELSLDMPDSLEQGIAGQATLQFNNDAPVLLAVTLERGVVADPFSGAFETTIFVLGDGSGGLATHHLNIKGSAGPNTSVRGEVALANAAAVSDFVARFQVSQPDFLPQEAQDRVADVLAGQFGATIGDVAQALLPYDKALTSFGLGGGSAATALAFAVEEAGDFGSIAERGLQGGMGQGWSSLADLGLQMEDGFVQLTGLGDPAVLAALSADLSAIYALSQSVGRTMLLSGTLLERDAGPRPAFQLGEDGVFRPANGFSGSLSQTETGFELRYPDGSLLSFDAAGQFLQMLGQDGSLTTANYDDNGRISALNGVNGAQLDFVYDESGRLTQVDDGTGASSEFTYDAEGRLIAATTADGSSAFGYEPLHGDLITANPAAGPNAVMSYDDQGRLTSVDLGAGLIGETIAYAPGGQITITDGAGRAVEVQLLPSGEVGRVDLGEGQAAGLDFNSTGQVIALQATDGTETTLSYDADGRVVGVTDANGAVLQFGYEGDETRPSSFTDAGGSTRSFIYDAEGRIAEAVWPDGSSLSFVYDAQGDLTGFENRRGDNTSYEYDAAGRLTFESDGSAGATSYGYDTEGRLTSTSNDHGTTTLAYNDAGQITTVGYPSGKTLNYTYNDSGLRSGLSDGNGYEVFYEYDSVGRLSGLRDGNGSIVNYGYDGSGSLLFEVNGNGTSTNYAYDALGRLEQIENRAPDDSLSSFHNYSYDNANQRTSDQSEDGTWTYGYDATGQLTSAQFASAVSGLADKSLSFEYDGAGNRTRTIEDGVETLYTVNALNQYTQVGGTSFAYDADGNMTSRSDGAGTTTYAYDIQNRLTEVRGADGTVLQFTYDVFGNRLSKVENGLTTEYLVDPFGLGNVIGEYQGGTLSGQFWHGHGLARTEVGGTLAYVDSNAVGSVTALTDATGAALNDYLYTPFGRSLLEIETLANDREFNGALGVLEDAPGLITMRARSYDAELGRFISEDPLWLTGDTENLYRFAYNNPAGFIDPAGEVPILLPVALAGAVWIGKALGVAEKAQRIQEAIQTGNPHIVENELREIVDEIGTGLYDPKNFIPPLGKLFKKLPENMQDNLSEAIKQLIGYAEPGVREAVENHREQAALNDLFDDPMQRYAPDLDNDGRPDNLEPGESYIPPVDPADPWDEDSTNTDPADASARNDGDPHLTTFDGTGYSFQAVGEFTMAIGDGFEMQTRTEAINSRVSVNTATAMTIGDHVVGIYAREVVPLVVNGTSVVLERGETLAVGEGTVYRGFFGGGGQLGNFDVYVVTDGAGNGFWVNVYYGANHLRPFVADDQNVRGLLGNLNGDRTDDFQLRDGTVLDQPLPQTVLYGAYADSWRITQEDSLFLYDEGQDTSSFSDLNFPIQITRIGDLDPTERAVAEQIARDAGLVQGSFEFETTVIDIVMTGDAVFAQLVADAPDFEEDFDPGGVTPVEINLAPIPGSDVALVAERGTVLIDVLPNDSDPEGDALLLLGGSIDAGGTVVVEDGQLHAAPNVNFAGQTTLRYELGDDQGNVVEGIVVLTVDAIATRLNGTVAAETLVGGVANNEIYANGGDDRLIGNWGDDTLDGGTGIDTAVFDGPQSAFTLTLSPDRVTITDRQSVGQDTDTLISIEFLDFDQNIDLFGDNPMDLDIFSGPAGLSAAEFGAIIELYIAYFNRAPDALGLLYWGTRYAEGHPLSEMANDFFNQDETKATYA